MSKKWIDFLERVAWTAVQAGAAVLIVQGFTWEALGIAGTAAGIAALKVVVAFQVEPKGDGALDTRALRSGG